MLTFPASSDRDRPLPAIATREGVTTLTVPKLSADDEAFRTSYATTLADGIAGASAATTCGFIVDARVNHGGDMSPMLAGLSPLLPDGRIGGFVDRHGATTELSVAGGSVRVGGAETFSVPAKPKPHRPVAVLQGPDTASSGEVVVLAFKGGADVRTFGEATAGYSTSNQTIRLYDGTQMLLTTAVDTDRSGATYGDVVKPDQAVPTAQAEQAARAWLAGSARGERACQARPAGRLNWLDGPAHTEEEVLRQQTSVRALPVAPAEGGAAPGGVRRTPPPARQGLRGSAQGHGRQAQGQAQEEARREGRAVKRASAGGTT